MSATGSRLWQTFGHLDTIAIISKIVVQIYQLQLEPPSWIMQSKITSLESKLQKQISIANNNTNDSLLNTPCSTGSRHSSSETDSYLYKQYYYKYAKSQSKMTFQCNIYIYTKDNNHFIQQFGSLQIVCFLLVTTIKKRKS